VQDSFGRFATSTMDFSLPDTQDFFQIYVKDSDSNLGGVKVTCELTLVFYSIFYDRKTYVDFGEDDGLTNWDEAGEDHGYVVDDTTGPTLFGDQWLEPPVG